MMERWKLNHNHLNKFILNINKDSMLNLNQLPESQERRRKEESLKKLELVAGEMLQFCMEKDLDVQDIRLLIQIIDNTIQSYLLTSSLKEIKEHSERLKKEGFLKR